MISRTGVHAVRALTVLARYPSGQFVGTASLAEKVEAPTNYLGKLLQSLVQTGLVESRKGAGGGFRLASPADSISLYDALLPVEDFDRWRGCLLGGRDCCETDTCALHDEWGELRDRYLDLLARTTIKTLAQQRDGVPPRAQRRNR